MIHNFSHNYHSNRKDKPFIPVNCGALPDHLFENELFGHAKGAYTDASTAEKGLVAEAEGGTLFLDEIDALSLSAQVKLLRFLQDQEYRPLGSSKTRTANVRIICASNADLRQLCQNKEFREDLYYRLNVLSLTVPPLRERPDDIYLLANHFLNVYRKQRHLEVLRFSLDALQKLLVYDWPGNVRELEGIIHRSVILSSPPIIQSADIDLPSQFQAGSFENRSFRIAKSLAIEQFERAYLTHLLSTHRGNISRAAKAVGKDRRVLQRLLRKYDLDRHAFR